MADAAVDETEADLMYECGHLYISMAFESFATTLMSMAFGYLLLLITNKGRLAAPGRAAINFVQSNVKSFYNDVTAEVGGWPGLKNAPLPKRFAFCRKSNQTLCIFSISICVLTIERWMHINNINGFRYLGYAVTCPPMQTQLVVLIAPVVPCYKLMCMSTYLLTTTMLIAGYGASLLRGEVYSGDLIEFMKTWDMNDLGPDRKGYWMMVPACILSFLTFIQLPYLAILYLLNGGDKNGLPHDYLKLLSIVATTWVAFPIWWMLSFEGKTIIEDTKMNAVGFAVLNIVSKGMFTLTMISITKWHKKEQQKKDYLEKGHEEAAAAPTTSPAMARADTWVVGLLRPFDLDEAPSSSWADLEPTFRAFLVGNGMNPQSWSTMPTAKRITLKEDYDNTMDMVIADDHMAVVQADRNFAGSNALKDGNRPVPAAAPPMPPPGPVMGMAAKPFPTDVMDQRPMAVEEEYYEEEVVEEQQEEVGLTAEQVEELSRKIKVGQTITTLYNVRGRVVRKVGRDKVQLAVKGKPAQTVRIEDVTVLKAIFLSARGLHSTEMSAGYRAFCTCSIQGRPSSEIRGPLASPGTSPTWADDEETDVLGYGPGDSLSIRLWAQQPHSKAEELLGEGYIAAAEMADGGYEGEVQMSVRGQPVNAFVSLLVVIVNHPEHYAEEEEEEAPQSARGRGPGFY